MNILVILAHPDPVSFNRAIAERVCYQLETDQHTVTFHDLYQNDFPPVLPGDEMPRDAALDPQISRYCDDLTTADGIVVVHPNWWGMPPAIVKGYIDRVFRPNVAYRFIEGDAGEGIPVGLLKAQAAIVINTANTPQMREEMVFGDPLHRIWKDCIFGLCGVSEFYRLIFRVVITSTPAERMRWLDDAATLTHEVFKPNES